jgi:hypothetical protein
MKIIKGSDSRRERWKNGGGWTNEIARGFVADDASPPSAEWDWRLSVAEIEQDGPFSSFPGVDRVLVLIEGAGMRLHFADGRHVDVTTDHPRVDFAGEDALDCALIGGVTRDFNLMWRRERCRAQLAVLTLGDVEGALQAPAAIRAMFLLSGTLRIDGHQVVAGDSVVFSMPDSLPRDIAILGAGAALLVGIDPVAPAV